MNPGRKIIQFYFNKLASTLINSVINDLWKEAENVNENITNRPEGRQKENVNVLRHLLISSNYLKWRVDCYMSSTNKLSYRWVKWGRAAHSIFIIIFYTYHIHWLSVVSLTQPPWNSQSSEVYFDLLFSTKNITKVSSDQWFPHQLTYGEPTITNAGFVPLPISCPFLDPDGTSSYKAKSVQEAWTPAREVIRLRT